LPSGESIASAENNSTTPPTPLTVGGQIGGNILVKTEPALNPSQRAALAKAVSEDPDLPAEVKGVAPGRNPTPIPTPGVQGSTYDENHIEDTPYGVAVDPDALPNSGKYTAPGVFSPGDIVQESGKPAYVYYISNNGDGTTTPYLVTAPANDPAAATTIKNKIDTITGTAGFKSINKGTMQAVFNNEASLVRATAASLKKMANQLSATPTENIDPVVAQTVKATIDRINVTSAYLLTSAAAADAANNSV
jgi:hypothetical protein